MLPSSIHDKDTGAADPFLGVRRSALGQMWVERPYVPRIAGAIAEKLDVSSIVGQLIAARGIDLDGAASFFDPSIRDSLPNPDEFKDMDKAVERIVAAITKGEKIAIFGDYDVDGATSSSVLSRFFSSLGVACKIYIPDRNIEGYGPNTNALLSLHRDGAALVITVDCGTLSYGPLEDAFNAGLDVIVVDHHKAETTLPKAVAVVNPNRLDESGEYGQLAAVGVAFIVAVGVNRALRESGWYERTGRSAPDLLSLLDLVALGTVCDVVPLTGVNRAFVSQGLKVMAKRGNVGLTALADVGRVNEAPTTYHAGFVLGPRVNAGGRVGEAPLGSRLLTCDDYSDACVMAGQLDSYNADRREIEAGVQEEAMSLMNKHFGPDGGPETMVFAVGKGWHAGVIGIVASRLKDKYQRPTFVLTIEDGIAKASGRSISGVDLGAAVIEAQAKGILLKGGGHAMAAGLSVAEDRIEELEAFLSDHMRDAVKKASASRALKLDGAISLMGCTVDLIDEINQAGPFGTGNAAPRFVIPDITLIKVDVVGQNHLRCIFKGKDGSSMKIMAFRAIGEPLGNALEKSIGKRFHVAGKLKKDDWGGTSKVEMTMDDCSIITSVA